MLLIQKVSVNAGYFNLINFFHTVEVGGSRPSAPTRFYKAFEVC
ncbi:MAG: hypothetical protein ACYCTB_10875 [bacterium]